MSSRGELSWPGNRSSLGFFLLWLKGGGLPLLEKGGQLRDEEKKKSKRKKPRAREVLLNDPRRTVSCRAEVQSGGKCGRSQ